MEKYCRKKRKRMPTSRGLRRSANYLECGDSSPLSPFLSFGVRRFIAAFSLSFFRSAAIHRRFLPFFRSAAIHRRFLSPFLSSFLSLPPLSPTAPPHHRPQQSGDKSPHSKTYGS
jgi:hypothetical protein